MLTRVSQEPLPPALRRRLVGIPKAEFLCRDLDRLWSAGLAGELEAEEAEALRAHRESCQRCRAVHSILAAAHARPLVPLPPGLQRRLKSIGEARGGAMSVPRWLTDVRYTATASYLAASILVFVVGDPTRVAMARLSSLAEPVAEAAEEVERRGEELLEEFRFLDLHQDLAKKRQEAVRLGGRLEARLEHWKAWFLELSRLKNSEQTSGNRDRAR